MRSPAGWQCRLENLDVVDEVRRVHPDILLSVDANSAYTIDDQDHFTVTARVGVSHIKGDVVMKLTIKDRQPPVSTTIVGKGNGLASMVDMVTSFTLESAGAGDTVVHWKGDVTISGKLAAFGPQGLMDRIARKNIDTFIEGIRSGLGAA